MLELKNIYKYYNPGTVNEMCLFENYNLTVKDGEFVSVVGSNGSGKTSMLNIICGSIPVENGKIFLDGKDITNEKEYKRNRKIGRVYQNPSGKTSMLNIICGSIPVENGKIFLDGKDITNEKEYKRNRKIGRVYQNPAFGTCPSMTILENMSLADHKGKFFGLQRGVSKKRMEYYQELLKPLNLGLEDKMHVKVGSLSGGQRQAMALLMSTMTPIEFPGNGSFDVYHDTYRIFDFG